jgi:hypothetical protein
MHLQFLFFQSIISLSKLLRVNPHLSLVYENISHFKFEQIVFFYDFSKDNRFLPFKTNRAQIIPKKSLKKEGVVLVCFFGYFFSERVPNWNQHYCECNSKSPRDVSNDICDTWESGENCASADNQEYTV